MSQTTTPPDKDKVVGLPRQPKEPATDRPEPAKVLPFEKPRRRCEVASCTNPHQARGRCMRHYHLLRRQIQINCDLLCTKCGVNRRYQGHSWCQECNNARARALFVKRYNSDPTYYSARRIKNMEANFRLKVRVLAGYGGRCNCCGESRISMLQIDHVMGGGNTERAQFAQAWRAVYQRAIRENFPDDLQCLCGSCHVSKTILGRCEHQGGEVDTLPPQAA